MSNLLSHFPTNHNWFLLSQITLQGPLGIDTFIYPIHPSDLTEMLNLISLAKLIAQEHTTLGITSTSPAAEDAEVFAATKLQMKLGIGFGRKPNRPFDLFSRAELQNAIDTESIDLESAVWTYHPRGVVCRIQPQDADYLIETEYIGADFLKRSLDRILVETGQ